MKALIKGAIVVFCFLLSACGGANPTSSTPPPPPVPGNLIHPDTSSMSTEEAIATAAKYKKAVADLTQEDKAYVVFVMPDDGCLLLVDQSLNNVVEPINRLISFTLDAKGNPEHHYYTLCGDDLVASGLIATAGQFTAMNGIAGGGIIQTSDYHEIVKYRHIFKGIIEDGTPKSAGRNEMLAQLTRTNLDLMKQFEIALQEAAKNQMAFVSIMVPREDCRVIINDDLDHPQNPQNGIVQLYTKPGDYSFQTYCGGQFATTNIPIPAGSFTAIDGSDGHVMNNPTGSSMDAYNNRTKFMWTITPKGR